MNTNSDSSIPAHFPCDIDECSQVTLAVEFERAEIVSLRRHTPVNEPLVPIVASSPIKYRQAI